MALLRADRQDRTRNANGLGGACPQGPPDLRQTLTRATPNPVAPRRAWTHGRTFGAGHGRDRPPAGSQSSGKHQGTGAGDLGGHSGSCWSVPGAAAAPAPPRRDLRRAALLAGVWGNAALYLVGLLLSIPMLKRLRGRFGSAVAPAVGVFAFTALFLVSALVIGPAFSGRQAASVAPPAASSNPSVDADHAAHHR